MDELLATLYTLSSRRTEGSRDSFALRGFNVDEIPPFVGMTGLERFSEALSVVHRPEGTGQRRTSPALTPHLADAGRSFAAAQDDRVGNYSATRSNGHNRIP